MADEGKFLIFGKHSCIEAIKNPERRIEQIFITRNNLESLKELVQNFKINIVTNSDLDSMIKQPSHQGIAIKTYPLTPKQLKDTELNSLIIILDHVSNPRNIGSILRTATAFEASCVIVAKRNSPGESGVLTKAACGAFEKIPLIRVANIHRTIEDLKKAGYWCVGLETSTDKFLHQSKLTRKTALILGSEGKGLRNLTTKACDEILKIKITGNTKSLNVSNAASIAMYHVYINSE